MHFVANTCIWGTFPLQLYAYAFVKASENLEGICLPLQSTRCPLAQQSKVLRFLLEALKCSRYQFFDTSLIQPASLSSRIEIWMTSILGSLLSGVLRINLVTFETSSDRQLPLCTNIHIQAMIIRQRLLKTSILYKIHISWTVNYGVYEERGW